MMRRSCLLIVVLTLAINVITVLARAGALLPCIAATLSAHGRVLVINDLTFDDPDETHVRTIKTSTFRVIRRYVDPNEGLRLNGPDNYWADTLWKVVLINDHRSEFSACHYTLVTDDGEYLVLVGTQIGPAALTIYRRRDHPGQPLGGPGPDHGVLIRQIAWTDLWPSEHAPEMFTDETPEWFAGGSFAFSANDTALLYKKSSGKSFQVDLATGSVEHK